MISASVSAATVSLALAQSESPLFVRSLRTVEFEPLKLPAVRVSEADSRALHLSLKRGLQPLLRISSTNRF